MATRKKVKPVRPGDRAASLIILSCLACIAVAVYISGHSDGTQPDLGTSPSTAVARGLTPSELGDLTLAGQRDYTADNLYEYIDGQAPHYIGFGFRALLVAEYAPKGAAVPSMVVDLYDMELRRNAYGLFMSTVPPEEEQIELGNAGYASGNVAVFWKGSYYVRVAGMTGGDLSREVKEAAVAIAANIRDDSTTLAEFSAFPQEGLLPGTLAYIKSAAFGLAYLRETFVAGYESSEGSYQLFFADLESPAAAVEVLMKHGEFLKSSDGLVSAEDGKDEKLVWGQDKYVGPTLFLARGNLVVGSIGLADRKTAESKSRELLDRAVRSLSSVNVETAANVAQ